MSELEDVRRVALGLAAELLERLRDPDLHELEVREAGVRVRVSKDATPAVAAAEPVIAARPADAPAAVERAARTVAPAASKTIAAPLTGVFYRSGSPQAPPFVQVGSVVAAGDVIGLIEAMKLFNEVHSTVSGRVVRIAAENGQLVRAHQPLVELE